MGFIGILSWDAWKGMWFTDSTGAEQFGIGVGTLVLTTNVILLGGYTFGCHSFRHLAGGIPRPDLGEAGAPVRLRVLELAERAAHEVRLVQPLLGGVFRRLRPALLDGRLDGFPDSLMQVAEHDVLVIGAGGAGLRAAIEASAAGASVGLVTKSLLGKAHTVMAEGGIAAALANVDGRDDWKTHFADTMRGGQYVGNPTMAELHAQEAPDRVRELEAWGAVFDRTTDQKILQRNFGGHKYPRLAHVGDRTGLEMIRTLQDHGIHLGIDVHMEWTVTHLISDGGRVVGAFGYDREKGRFQVFRASAVVLATGGIGVPTGSPPTVGSTPATGTRSPTRRGRSSSTWSTSSSTRPGWSGRRASAASW